MGGYKFIDHCIIPDPNKDNNIHDEICKKKYKNKYRIREY